MSTFSSSDVAYIDVNKQHEALLSVASACSVSFAIPEHNMSQVSLLVESVMEQIVLGEI